MPKRKTKPKPKPKTDNHVNDTDRMQLMSDLCQVIADNNADNEDAHAILESIREWVAA